MKFYIATSLSRAAEHNLVRDDLVRFGYELVYDWTEHGSVKSTSLERLKEVGERELHSLTRADFVVVLLPGGFGTHVEIGFSLSIGSRVFLHSEDPKPFELGPQTCAFYHHPKIEQLVCSLQELASLVHSKVIPLEEMMSSPFQL